MEEKNQTIIKKTVKTVLPLVHAWQLLSAIQLGILYFGRSYTDY